jgi:hypothetical protein
VVLRGSPRLARARSVPPWGRRAASGVAPVVRPRAPISTTWRGSSPSTAPGSSSPLVLPEGVARGPNRPQRDPQLHPDWMEHRIRVASYRSLLQNLNPTVCPRSRGSRRPDVGDWPHLRGLGARSRERPIFGGTCASALASQPPLMTWRRPGEPPRTRRTERRRPVRLTRTLRHVVADPGAHGGGAVPCGGRRQSRRSARPVYALGISAS